MAMGIPAQFESGWRLEEAARVWLSSVAAVLPGTIVYADPQSAIPEIVEECAPVLVIAAPGQLATFLSGGTGALYRPVFVAERGNGITTEYVALAAAGTSLADHRGGMLLCDVSDGSSVVQMAWLAEVARSLVTEASDLGERLPVPFFQTGRTDRPARAILPVFFGSASVAVTSRSDFEATAKLNPQVAETVHVVAASPPLLGSTIFIRTDLTDDREAAILGELSILGRTKEGQTLLRNFGWRGLRPYSEEIGEIYSSTLAAMGFEDGRTLGAPRQQPLAGVPTTGGRVEEGR